MHGCGRANVARLAGRCRSGRGQAAVETALMMSFLIFLIFAIVHMAIYASLKSLVNDAAFSASRTLMVRPTSYDYSWTVLSWLTIGATVDVGTAWGWVAAAQILGTSSCSVTQGNHRGQEVIFVSERVPFALPAPGMPPMVPITGFSPRLVQPDIPEKGDNAQ